MKLILVIALVAAGAIAAVLSSQRIAATHDETGSAHVVRTMGALAVIVGTLAALNFLYALVLVRRLEGGHDILGRWTVPPDEFDRFSQVERSRKKRKNNWRVLRRAPAAGVPVIFSRDAVLIGKTYFQLRAKGMSRFTNARIDTESIASIEFSMSLRIVGAGSQGRTARYRGHLRVPMAGAARAEAGLVVGYFQRLVSS